MPEDASSSSSAGRFEAVLAEIIQAEEEGRAIDEERYLDSFPQFAGPLREYFRNRDHFIHLMGPGVPSPSAEPAAPSRPALEVGSVWAGYEIEEELGRGGMGIVYRARQLRPERQVALKVIRRDRLEALSAGERQQWLDRFQREAQLVAALDRPDDIVSLYEVGEHAGLSYFTMRLVAGGTLAARLKRHREGDPARAREQRLRGQRDSARLLARVARAVHYAHERGVLHRDLKPANILLDERGRPLVSDFGLARRVDQTGSLVASGIEGTAEYMSPEQARATPGAATTAADVYSLGAILYECLTGQPPFQGSSPVQTLMLILHEKLIPPRRREPRLDRDLETICLKCLQEEPARRYSSAAALADDLDSWLEGRTIQARPAGALERSWRWCRRNPIPSAAAALIVATVAIAFVLIYSSRARAIALADEKGRLAEENAGLANRERSQKERLQELADTNANLAKDKDLLAKEEHRQRRRAEWQLTRETLSRGLDLCDRGETADGALWLARGLDLAARAEAADLERAARLNLAYWGSRLHPLTATLHHDKQVSSAAFSPDGRRLVTASKDGTARLWDVSTGRPVGESLRHGGTVWAVAFSPDSKRIATGGDGGARLWEAATGRPLGEPLGPPTAVWAVAFAADGKTLLTIRGDSVQRWDASSGKQAGPALPRRPRRILPPELAFRADGKAVVMTGPDGAVRMLDPATGKPLGRPLAHPGELEAAAFSSDGRLVLTGSSDGMARLWRTDTGKLLRELPHPRPVYLMAFSPDDRTLLTTRDDKVWLWDANSGKLLATLPHRGPVYAVVFSPDGRALLTASGSGSDWGMFRNSEVWGEARLWDVASGSLLGPPLPHRYPVECLAFSPDGRTFLTGNGDLSSEYPPGTLDVGTAWLWQTADPLERPAVSHDVPFTTAAAFRPDGKVLATTSMDGQVRLWDPAVGEMLRPPLRHSGGVTGAAFSPDGKTLAVGVTGARGVQLWDLTTGRPLGEPLGQPMVLYVAFSPQGDTVLAIDFRDASQVGEARLWDVKSGRQVGATMTHRGPIFAPAWSHDGQTILTGSGDGTARLWKARTGEPIGKPLEHRAPVLAVALAPDGQMALTGAADGTACLWNAATGERIGEPLRHRGPVVAVAFSPDGRTLLTGGQNGTAHLWDTATRKPVGEPMNHRGQLVTGAVAFNPDGSLILTGYRDGTARLWEASTGLPIGPPWRHQGAVTALAFSPDGKTLVTAGEDGRARIWKVPRPVAGPAARAALWPEVVTGRRLESDRVVRLLTSDEWSQTARQLEAGIASTPPFDALDWHRREARAREVLGQWFAVAWHLGHLIDAAPEQTSLYARRGRAYVQMQQAEPAAADFSRVIERNKDSALAWFERGHVYLLDRRWDKAVQDLSRAIELGSDFGPAWHQRGYARAALGQWKPAAADLNEAVKRPGAPAEALSHQALTHLALEDAEGYRKACQALQQSPGAWVDATSFALTAWTCAVGPSSGVDLRPALAAPLTVPPGMERYLFLRAVGATLYRAGDFEGALGKLREALEAARQAGQDGGTPTVWLLLAMAEHGRGKAPDEARRWLEKARSWMADARKPAPDGSAPGETTWDRIPWPDRLAVEVLEREAGKRIDKKAPGK